MLTEFLRYLSEQSVKASMPRVLQTPEPGFVYAIAKPDGEYTWEFAEPAPRQHIAGNLQTVIDFALRKDAMREVAGEPGSLGEPVVWYNRSSVVCVLDDYTRRDRIALPLPLSKQMQTLQAIEGRNWTQQDLILLLRTTFRHSLADGDTLIATLRRLKFIDGSAVDSAVQHGRASVGKEIRAEISSMAGSLPEYVSFSIPIFENPTLGQLRGTIEVALEPLPTRAEFRLIPVAGDIEGALAGAEYAVGEMLREALAEAEVGVFFGSVNL
jgi:hypothetical protein